MDAGGGVRQRAQGRPGQELAAYIGAFNSGASKVSIPILSQAGVPQISPANTYVGLTTNDPGSEPGEPDKYYPTGQRTYVRIVPKDTIQAAALVTLMKTDGCTKVAMTNDKEVYGAGLARVIELSAKTQGLTIVSNDAIDKNAPNYRSLASKAKAAGADCFLYSGITANNAVQQFKDFASALGPNAKLYGPDGVAETGFVSEKAGGIPAALDPRVKVTVATLSPDKYPPDGPGLLQVLHGEVRRRQPRPVRDLWLRGDEAGPRRDPALQDRLTRPTSSRPSSPPRTATACSAITRSTRTATRRSPITAPTPS